MSILLGIPLFLRFVSHASPHPTEDRIGGFATCRASLVSRSFLVLSPSLHSVRSLPAAFARALVQPLLKTAAPQLPSWGCLGPFLFGAVLGVLASPLSSEACPRASGG